MDLKSQQDLCLCDCLAAHVQDFFFFFQCLIRDSKIKTIICICVCRAANRNKSVAEFFFSRKSEKRKQTCYLCMPSDVAPLLPVPSLHAKDLVLLLGCSCDIYRRFILCQVELANTVFFKHFFCVFLIKLQAGSTNCSPPCINMRVKDRFHQLGCVMDQVCFALSTCLSFLQERFMFIEEQQLVFHFLVFSLLTIFMCKSVSRAIPWIV